MSILALDLNGAGVTAVSDREGAAAEETIPASPGYALLDGDRLVTGAEAAQQARLKPRFTHSRFWEEIDTTPLSRPFPKSFSRADLAHAHLEEIWRSLERGATEVLLTVPGWYTDGQLGQLSLILGIAHACDMPVTGIVDSAVATSALGFSGQKLLHLDLHLHRTVATELEQAGGIRRRRVAVSKQVGLVLPSGRLGEAHRRDFRSPDEVRPLVPRRIGADSLSLSAAVARRAERTGGRSAAHGGVGQRVHGRAHA